MEMDTYFKVPPGCTIVVKAHSGERTFERNFKTFCSLPLPVLQDPEENSVDIFEAFQSVAIFKEGDWCPNFMYVLQGCYPGAGVPFGDYKFCDKYGSGVLDMAKIKESGACEANQLDIEHEDLDSYEKMFAYILSLYENSAFPTRAEVEKEFTDNMETLRDPKFSHERKHRRMTRLLKAIHKKTTTTQEDLLLRITSPNVFYNFICRETPATSALFENEAAPNATGRWRANRRPVNVATMRPPVAAALKRNMMEAESHRKPLLHGYFQSERYRALRETRGRSSPRSPREKTTVHDLYRAISIRSPDVVNDLYTLRRGQDINQVFRVFDFNEGVEVEQTCLSVAIHAHLLDLIPLLIASGADPRIVVNGKTVAQLGAESSYPAIRALFAPKGPRSDGAADARYNKPYYPDNSARRAALQMVRRPPRSSSPMFSIKVPHMPSRRRRTHRFTHKK